MIKTGKSNMTTRKAQSAMEYLMTYGWAILIIAVVLGALFSLGVFNGNSILGTSCVAATGYLCQSPLYSHTTGFISVTLGQTTGTSWASTNIMFVPSGQAVSGGLPVTLTSAAFTAGLGNVMTSGLSSGQSVALLIPDNIIALPTVGTPATGTLWVQYVQSSCAACTFQYAQIATLNVKAT
jgi:hypothetical protein